MADGKIYGRPANHGGRPPTIDPEAQKRRKNHQLALSVMGAMLVLGICCGGCLALVGMRIIHL